jgi:hypothetical protein
MKTVAIIITMFELVLITSAAHAYELYFSNFTDKILIIVSKKRAAITQEKYAQIIRPFESVIQPWSDLNCLESLQWAEVDSSLPHKGGLKLIDSKHGYQISSSNQKIFNEQLLTKYAWSNLPIKFVPNELFTQTQQAATELVQGIDEGICSVLDFIAPRYRQITQTLSSSKDTKGCLALLGQIADAAGKITGISICKSRQFFIFDTGKKDPFTRQPSLIAETNIGE